MGQEVKNLLRAQSKYGLMGSSAKKGKKIFRGSQWQFLDKTVIWDRTPPSYTSTMAEGWRVPNLQTEFNYLDSFKSYCIFSDFIVPVVPTSYLSSLYCPHHPLSSQHHPNSPQKVPMWSPWLWSPWSPPYVVPVVPVVPTSSSLSPHHPHHPHVIPTSSKRFPHHPQPLRHPLNPPSTP